MTKTIAAMRVAIRTRCSSVVQHRAASNAMAGITGRMYCGRFDCEIEKKRNGTITHNAAKTITSSRRSRRHDISAGMHHGSEPPITNGMKYHGGPVRLSAFVARRWAVSVTST